MKKITKTNAKYSTVTPQKDWRVFLDAGSHPLYPSLDEFGKRMALTYLEWAEQDSSLLCEQFLNEYKLSWHVFWKMQKKYPELKEAHDMVKQILFTRRSLGVLHQKLDKDMVLKDLHRYNPAWGTEVNDYWTEKKQKIATAGAGSANITLHVVDEAKNTLKEERMHAAIERGTEDSIE